MGISGLSVLCSVVVVDVDVVVGIIAGGSMLVGGDIVVVVVVVVVVPAADAAGGEWLRWKPAKALDPKPARRELCERLLWPWPRAPWNPGATIEPAITCHLECVHSRDCKCKKCDCMNCKMWIVNCESWIGVIVNSAIICIFIILWIDRKGISVRIQMSSRTIERKKNTVQDKMGNIVVSQSNFDKLTLEHQSYLSKKNKLKK